MYISICIIYAYDKTQSVRGAEEEKAGTDTGAMRCPHHPPFLAGSHPLPMCDADIARPIIGHSGSIPAVDPAQTGGVADGMGRAKVAEMGSTPYPLSVG